jgi:regulator of sirC expression with transglutaminase-like and TPR domain
MFEPIPDLDYFKLLVRDPRAIPLIEAAASLGIDAYPAMDLQDTVSRFDTLARELAARCRNDTTEVARLQSLIFFVYEEMGFSGNVNDYYNPDNSYLHRVLDTRRGIPITLALLFSELARHIGLESAGVAFPGHFLVRLKLSQGVVVIGSIYRSRASIVERGPHARASWTRKIPRAVRVTCAIFMA